MFGSQKLKEILSKNWKSGFNGWEDEKDFTLKVPMNPQNDRVYYKGDKKDVPEANLFHHSNRQSKKVMVSACLSWNGATKPLFVLTKVSKSMLFHTSDTSKRNFSRLLKSCLVVWIFFQDGAPSRGSNLVQEFLKEKLKKRFVKKKRTGRHLPRIVIL